MKSTEQNFSRKRIDFNFDWKFYMEAEGHGVDASAVDYDDRGWDTVQLPHDFSIAQPVEEDSPGKHMSGYISGGVGWYRKVFRLDREDVEVRNVLIDFDAVYRNSEVWLNGAHLGKRCNGYASFRYDLTPHLKLDDENVLVVRADNSDLPNCRWYSGSGIIRPVWLESRAKLALTPDSVFVRTRDALTSTAKVLVSCEVWNDSDSEARATVRMTLRDAEGKEVATEESRIELKASGAEAVDAELPVEKPELWASESPYLYTLTVEVLNSRGHVVDDETVRVGIREVVLDSDQGLLLNGDSIKIKGGCLHNDGGCVGGAVPEAVWHRRFKTIKSLGANALRFAHNPPPREVLDLCDEYGFLVVDEPFDKWEMGATGFGEWLSNIHPRFAEDWRKDLDAMVLRDRNHPSVIIWSVGNEVMEYCRDPEKCLETYRKLAKRTKELDPTRPVSQALIYTTNREDALHESGLAEAVDLICLNYQEFNYPHDRERRPDKLILGTETRMFFGVPRKKANAGDAMDEGEIDVGIGDVSRKAMYLAENPWQAVERHDYVIGGMLWSLVDYLGEAAWPNRGWSGGIIDTAGNAKTWANYFACAWSDEPRVRIQVRDNSLPIPMGRTSWDAPKSIDHWNWPDYENELVLVETPTNCDSVELVLNGDSCGRRKTAYSKNNTIEWWVPYEPGKLEAFGYDAGGEKVCEWSLETSGPATALRVTLDREYLSGDGHDVVHADVSFVDDEGREVRTEFKPVNFFVSGHGELLGIDTGNIRCHESYVGQRRTSYFGRCVGLVRARRGEGVINIRVSSKGFPTVSVEVHCG